MFAWLMHLMSKIFGSTAKENMEKMETANDAEEESEDSSDDDEGGSGDEEGRYSSAQGGLG